MAVNRIASVVRQAVDVPEPPAPPASTRRPIARL
jgi:hypothetical protein